jgi:hypothetical protein
MEHWVSSTVKSLLLVATCTIMIACGGGGSSSASSDIARQPTTNSPGTSPLNDSELQLSWYIPDARENGDDLEIYEIEGYRIYYAAADSAIEDGNQVDIDDPQTTDYSITGLPSGDYRLAISTIDTQGLESSLSPEIIASVP